MATYISKIFWIKKRKEYRVLKKYLPDFKPSPVLQINSIKWQ